MNINSVVRLREGEEVVQIVRRFWWIYMASATLALVLIVTPFFFLVPLLRYGRWGMVVFTVVFLCGLIYGLRVYIIWHWNSFVITNFRIIDIDRRGFFQKIISESPYDKIQNVSYDTKGVFGTIFSYGAVLVQNFSGTSSLQLRDVRNPKDIHHLIIQMMDEHSNLHEKSGKKLSDEDLLIQSN